MKIAFSQNTCPPYILEVFPKMKESFESNDYAAALDGLDVLTTNLMWLWLRRGYQDLSENPSLATGQRLIELMCQDSRSGGTVERDDVLLGVWFLDGCKGA